jgi:hypothetical protein
MIEYLSTSISVTTGRILDLTKSKNKRIKINHSTGRQEVGAMEKENKREEKRYDTVHLLNYICLDSDQKDWPGNGPNPKSQRNRCKARNA